MIKVKNQTATREPIPAFLLGLAPESLADLSWTDPSLGVSDCKWLPEQDDSPALKQYEVYGDETLTIDAENKRVVSNRAVVPMTQEQIDTLAAEQAAQLQARKDTLTAQINDLQAQLAAL
jgi:hypothetical protein